MRKVIALTLIVCFVLNVSGLWGYEKTSTVLMKFEDGTAINAEVARDKARGLMFRDSLNENEGMFFSFDEMGKYGFWMKNMKFPLDIIWLDENFRVVHIEENVPPCNDECPTYIPERPAKYVLEVQANFAVEHSVGLGDKVYATEEIIA